MKGGHDLDSYVFFERLAKPAVDENIQFALELLTRTQGHSIWLREV